MSNYTLTVIETSGIQNYIFGSNKLQHIIGASHLVYEATHDRVYQILVDMQSTNIDKTEKRKTNSQQQIDKDMLNSELIYVGGGNVVILFKDKALAKTFTKQLTHKALTIAPNLRLTATHQPINWQETGSLKQAIDEAFKALGQKKAQGTPSVPLLGLGVTATCQYTDLPAVDYDHEKNRISAEILSKSNATVVKRANNRLVNEVWPQDCPYKPTYRADLMGRSVHESSYLAVVHIDGNGVGKRIEALADKYGHDNREYLNQLRSFSEKLSDSSETSLQHLLSMLYEAVDPTGHTIGGKVKLSYTKDNNKNKTYYLPFRPLVFGGDDLTFICDGRLALTLTVAYMEHYQQHLFPAKEDEDKPITTRAGVAIVKTHYPFAQAYNLAEDLAKNAKCYKDDNEWCTLDWHIAATGSVLDIKAIRKREYTLSGDRKLSMRPIRVIGDGFDENSWRSWQDFEYIVTKFNDKKKWPRNKVKMLREVLRRGADDVKAFRLNFNQEKLLPNTDNLSRISSFGETGWHGKDCAYFDPIEALDFYVSLPKKEDV